MKRWMVNYFSYYGIYSSTACFSGHVCLTYLFLADYWSVDWDWWQWTNFSESNTRARTRTGSSPSVVPFNFLLCLSASSLYFYDIYHEAAYSQILEIWGCNASLRVTKLTILSLNTHIVHSEDMHFQILLTQQLYNHMQLHMILLDKVIIFWE